MKSYLGKRTIDGLVVTVDGNHLDERYDVRCFTRFGFEWTYEGGSPRQLALAILMDHLNDAVRAVALSDAFMKHVVANFDQDWLLTSDDVAAAVQAIDPGRAAGSSAAAPGKETA